MRSLFAAFAGLTFLTCAAAQAHVDITVDKNNQVLTVAVDGVTRYHWPVSTGIPSYETPGGTYHAFRMEEDHFSKEFDDAPMPHSIFFTKIGHAIHGTDHESSLGRPASHGCVRLSKAHASTLYALVQSQGVLNTTVRLTGSSRIALARNPSRNTAIARSDTAQPSQQYYSSPQYSSSPGQPVVLTPQVQYYAARRAMPQDRPDDGYIYPADGSSNAQVYPAPRSSRRAYNAQAYPQPQYNQGYAPAPQGYYNQRQY